MGETGDRLEESKMINLSLSALAKARAGHASTPTQQQPASPFHHHHNQHCHNQHRHNQHRHNQHRHNRHH
eukprot:4799873-Pleurochrysis_carterae.AAC.1